MSALFDNEPRDVMYDIDPDKYCGVDNPHSPMDISQSPVLTQAGENHDGPPTTSAWSAGEFSDAASAGHRLSAGLWPNTYPKKHRSLSLVVNIGGQSTPNFSRSDLAGDITAAKQIEALKAREADVETREARLRNDQAEYERRAQALQASELEVTHLHERAQRADEHDGMREQRMTIVPHGLNLVKNKKRSCQEDSADQARASTKRAKIEASLRQSNSSLLLSADVQYRTRTTWTVTLNQQLSCLRSRSRHETRDTRK
ncbi:hypothetical protein Q7P37_006927 [Cladosporium fusiforme]